VGGREKGRKKRRPKEMMGLDFRPILGCRAWPMPGQA
jgi:hypothetical protein